MNLSGGNGGLSLRKVSRIRMVLEQEQRRKGDGALEDMWLATRLQRLVGSKMPNATISKHFSVESVWDDRPLGYHIGWLGVHHEQVCLSFDLRTVTVVSSRGACGHGGDRG